MRNLHSGANLHRGANLHPGCIFGHVNGVLRICTRCKFAPTLEVVQTYLHPGANLLPGANRGVSHYRFLPVSRDFK